MGHLPLLSEKMDTAKDAVLVAVAAHLDALICVASDAQVDGPILAVALLVVLAASQVSFLRNPDVRGELLETYCPILLSIPTEAPTAAERLVGSREEAPRAYQLLTQVGGQRVTQEGQTGYATKVGASATKILLKQISPARWHITTRQDIPQGFAGIYICVCFGGSPFVVASLALSGVIPNRGRCWGSDPVSCPGHLLGGASRRHELSRVRRDLVSADLLPRDDGCRCGSGRRSSLRLLLAADPILQREFVNEAEKKP